MVRVLEQAKRVCVPRIQCRVYQAGDATPPGQSSSGYATLAGAQAVCAVRLLFHDRRFGKARLMLRTEAARQPCQVRINGAQKVGRPFAPWFASVSSVWSLFIVCAVLTPFIALSACGCFAFGRLRGGLEVESTCRDYLRQRHVLQHRCVSS